MVTSKMVQRDIYNALRGSELSRNISGRIYYDGTRERDSMLEDVEVVFTYGTTDGQTASGVVTLLVYFPDVDPYGNGVMVEGDMLFACSGETKEEIGKCAAFVDDVKISMTNYKIGLRQSIMTQAQTEINQHFVSVMLSYETIEN